MSSITQVESLSSWVEDSAARVRETAASTQRGGDDAWIGVIEQLGVSPLTSEERLRHLEQGAPISRGALPMEFRWAMEAIVRQAEPRCRALDMALEPGDDAAQRAVDKLAHRLSSLVDEELRSYMSAVRPTISTSSIFANALATTQNYMAGAQGAGVSTVNCPCCGAPRRDGSDSLTCEFCGSEITG
jgi:hypothetical protein